MTNHTVEKIGGTSMLRHEELLENVLIGSRKGDDLYNRIFVVSAYGGITDKLLEHKKTGEPGVHALFASTDSEWAWGDALTAVGRDMQAINAKVLDDTGDRRAADDFVRERIEGVRSCLIDLSRLCSFGQFRLEEHLMTVREMVSALGEAHSAMVTALLLRNRGVNARFVDLTGWRDDSQPSLDERICTALEDVDFATEMPILPGYAQCKESLVKSHDRGYTEVTFARVAALTEAREAVIHKEFHLCSADPKTVGLDKVRVIGRTNYDVADQLSNMGMEAIHPRAAKGLRQAGIPLRVRNAFRPQDSGTLILDERGAPKPRVDMIAGLRGVFALQFFEQDMVGVKGYDAAILEVLTRHKMRIVTKTCNANTITHFIDGSMKSLKRVERDLAERFPASEIEIERVAIVSVIGRNLTAPGLTLRALQALSEAGIAPLGMQDLTRRVDLQFVIDDKDYDGTLRTLHAALVESDIEAMGQDVPGSETDLRDAA
ncbi:aspartate kinase [Aurantimonas coralicida]|uniref:aspartate kinase n=1 Tax=Aurantimonas coralicida TaxID=182270 RepID=UPI001D194D17|nr:aspartate kinase [Aurantimonas coralicida]MCC4299177.1 aspartate kinase [Aurantimonas coralicida]